MKLNWKVATGMLLGLTITGGTIIWLQVNPEDWGIKNSMLLFMGILIFLSSLLYRKENYISHLVNPKTGQIYLSSAIVGGLIILIYIWIISIGRLLSAIISHSLVILLHDHALPSGPFACLVFTGLPRLLAGNSTISKPANLQVYIYNQRERPLGIYDRHQLYNLLFKQPPPHQDI